MVAVLVGVVFAFVVVIGLVVMIVVGVVSVRRFPGRGFGVDVVFGGMVLDSVAVMVMVFVGGRLGGVDAVHDLADLQDGLGAVRLVGELQAGAVLLHHRRVGGGAAAAESGQGCSEGGEDASVEDAGHAELGG